MTERIIAVGRPYSAREPRVLFCHQGERWCGWLRTSNNEKQHMKYTAEREGHETHCKGGLILL